jgi:hypothetical protein
VNISSGRLQEGLKAYCEKERIPKIAAVLNNVSGHQPSHSDVTKNATSQTLKL